MRVILDTDMGNDIDDAIALAMLHAMADAGECVLLAILISKDNPWSPVFTSLLNDVYSHSCVPIGMVSMGPTPDGGKFTQAVSVLHQRGHDSYRHEDAVRLMRRTLAEEADGAVTIITIGFFTNLSKLADSPPDDLSPLTGLALLQRKVCRVVSMAGRFDFSVCEPEYNVEKDIPAAANFFKKCPVPMVFSGYEVGSRVLFPGKFVAGVLSHDAFDPVCSAYAAFDHMPYDRPCWDQTAVLHAVRPDAPYFGLSNSGAVSIDESGVVHFLEQPEGLHRYLILKESQIGDLTQDMLDLCGRKLGAAPLNEGAGNLIA